MTKIALRIDADTLRGTHEGVPRLVDVLDKHGIRGLFLFSVGPDNMGRHLWRLLKPAFFWKMLRSNAPGLYGWDILLRGTFWPGPTIADHEAAVIKACASAGHEIGVHAWDHQYWQSHIEAMGVDAIRQTIGRATETLGAIIGRLPDCSAAPGWRCRPDVLAVTDDFHFRYNSDCLGTTVFFPRVSGTVLQTPQIPRTMPTYDELIGRHGVTRQNYNDRLLAMVRENDVNLLTIHAEVEGGICLELFEEFIRKARLRGYDFCPPGELLPSERTRQILPDDIEPTVLPGREGWMACQASAGDFFKAW